MGGNDKEAELESAGMQGTSGAKTRLQGSDPGPSLPIIELCFARSGSKAVCGVFMLLCTGEGSGVHRGAGAQQKHMGARTGPESEPGSPDLGSHTNAHHIPSPARVCYSH